MEKSRRSKSDLHILEDQKKTYKSNVKTLILQAIRSASLGKTTIINNHKKYYWIPEDVYIGW